MQDILEWAYSELEKEVGEDRTMNPATVRRKLTSLRGRFTHAVRLGFTTANPVAQVLNDNQALFVAISVMPARASAWRRANSARIDAE